MSRYVVEEAAREGEPLVVLRDTTSGAEARIWPGCGANCFTLQLQRPSGDLVRVIQDAPSLAEIRRWPSWWGIPLLFPFPGVIPKGEYAFEGQRLRLGRPEQPIISEGNERPGTRRDYHGFVMDLPWKVAHTEGGDAAATVRCALDSADHPETQEGFPFPFRVAVTHRLEAGTLRLGFQVENPGPGNLPFGFGAHPYFRAPLGEQGTSGDCLVRIPAARRWNGRALRPVLEGTAPLAWEEICPPVDEALDLRTPRPFVERAYNGMYTDLTLIDGKVEAFLRDPLAGLEAVMRATPNVPNVVIWSPPGRQELCFEPWTCPSNVFNLAANGIPNHGLTVLAPGEAWEATMWITLREAAG